MRWSVEQVESVAPSPSTVTAAHGIASPPSWRSTGADDRAVWGSCQGSGAEPYDTAVDHVDVAFRCSCPSRQNPCKHAVALLLLWSRGQVPAGSPPSSIGAWLARHRTREAHPAGEPGAEAGDTGELEPGRADGQGDGGERGDGADADDGARPPEPPGDDADRDASRDDRVARMLAGLTELDRWLDDRVRTGLADPALARYSTWDSLAARLVDAQAGSLANRIRRLAGLVGASPGWHADVLAELGVLHLLSQS
ncbi:MAG: SWIM zinc finger family protein, partial [Ilumatobacteraceae bacterium]